MRFRQIRQRVVQPEHREGEHEHEVQRRSLLAQIDAQRECERVKDDAR